MQKEGPAGPSCYIIAIYSEGKPGMTVHVISYDTDHPEKVRGNQAREEEESGRFIFRFEKVREGFDFWRAGAPWGGFFFSWGAKGICLPL